MPPGVRRVLAAAEEAKKKNLKVGVGLQRHHQAGYIETLKRLHDGAIGEIVAMRCYWNGQRPWQKKRADLEKQYGRKLTEMEYQMRNWYYFIWICGDHIDEQHIHNIDVINWVKNAHPVKARAMGGREISNGPDDGEIFDHFAVRVRVRGRLDLQLAVPPPARLLEQRQRSTPKARRAKPRSTATRSTATTSGASKPRARKTPTSRSTTISSPPSATTSHTAKPNPARTAP